jgi:Ca2+-binding EF-hand superfamily protein
MGNTSSIDFLQTDTHFSHSALKELNDKFLKKYPNGKLTKDEFINGKLFCIV